MKTNYINTSQGIEYHLFLINKIDYNVIDYVSQRSLSNEIESELIKANDNDNELIKICLPTHINDSFFVSNYRAYKLENTYFYYLIEIVEITQDNFLDIVVQGLTKETCYNN